MRAERFPRNRALLLLEYIPTFMIRHAHSQPLFSLHPITLLFVYSPIHTYLSQYSSSLSSYVVILIPWCLVYSIKLVLHDVPVYDVSHLSLISHKVGSCAKCPPIQAPGLPFWRVKYCGVIDIT